jgi:PAS domain S-box-containing protein
VLVKRMTQGFMAFTVVYSLHGMFTPVSTHHMMLFLLYGPVSRFLMAVLLLLAVHAQSRPVQAPQERRHLNGWWRFLALLMLVNAAVAALALSEVGQQQWPRLSFEAAAVLCNVLSLVLVLRASARTPLMRYYTLALAWFAAASLGFVVAQPWNHLWWLAHGIFAVGFTILGYGVLMAYVTTHALDRVFSSEELFDDLNHVNARLLLVSQDFQRANDTLERQVLELERSRHAFASFLEAVPDAVFIVEVGGRIQELNTAAERLFQYASRRLLGMPVETLIPQRLHSAHTKARQHFEFSPHTREMGSRKMPLSCLRRDGSEFLANASLGSLLFEGRQCVAVFIRPVTSQMEHFARQRELDQLQIERGQALDALLAIVPGMVFELRRASDGSFTAGVRSAACERALSVSQDASPADWVRQWFNLVVPLDLPNLIAAIEVAAVQGEALQLQWRHHVSGRGIQAYSLSSAKPQTGANGSLAWLCAVQAVG